MLGICRTRTKKSSPNLFNFYAILAGHDMITYGGRATKCSWYFEAPWLETKVQITEDFSKMIYTKICLNISDEEKNWNKTLDRSKITVENMAPKYNNIFWQKLCKI